MYIVHRTQLYLDDDLWNALRMRARTERTTISELVRQAAREHYLGKLEERRKAMQAFIGMRKNRGSLTEPDQFVRRLRRGSRIERLSNK